MTGKRVFAAAILAAALAVHPHSLRAQDAAQSLDKAKADLAAGKPVDAYLTLSNALAGLAARTPLFLTAAAFIDGPVRGYGQYDPRPHSSFTRAETIRVYVEPAGFDHRREGELYRASLACDYAVLGADGKQVTADRAVKEVELASRQPNAELAVEVALPYLDLPAGAYTLEIAVRDRIAGDGAAARLQFRVLQ
ncbi:MAG: hypothetical protein ACT4N4_14760 [Rhodospirillales bacterium]